MASKSRQSPDVECLALPYSRAQRSPQAPQCLRHAQACTRHGVSCRHGRHSLCPSAGQAQASPYLHIHDGHLQVALVVVGQRAAVPRLGEAAVDGQRLHTGAHRQAGELRCGEARVRSGCMPSSAVQSCTGGCRDFPASRETGELAGVGERGPWACCQRRQARCQGPLRALQCHDLHHATLSRSGSAAAPLPAHLPRQVFCLCPALQLEQCGCLVGQGQLAAGVQLGGSAVLPQRLRKSGRKGERGEVSEGWGPSSAGVPNHAALVTHC